MPATKPQLNAPSEAASRRRSTTVLNELRRRIVTQDLAPGAALREQELANEFGVSRARIRDTFGILEERGLIERVPHRGAVVAKLDPRRVDELYAVREVLEGLVVRLATENATPGHWDQIARLFGPTMEGLLAQNDFDAYEDAVHHFRRECIEAADNVVLRDLLDGLYDRIQVLIRRLVLVPGRALEGMYQHRKILEAMRTGNAAEAERLKRANIRSARDWFQNYRKYLM